MILADTGAFLALYHRPDQFHERALEVWPTVKGPVLTTNYIVAEFVNLLGRRVGFANAAKHGLQIYESKQIEVVISTRTDELAALGLMRKYADQDVTVADCVSFAIMRRLRIQTAFTFDRHFRMAGFRLIGIE